MGGILGVDLSGRDGNPTGFCLILEESIVSIGFFRTLKYLLEYIQILKPKLVSIDSPLNLPARGRFRDCDIMLKKHGMSPLPPAMPSMRMLVERAIILTNILSSLGIRYIETFPSGAIRMLGYKRKPRSISERRRYAREIARLFGLRIHVDFRMVTKDEFDAFLCALAGYAYLKKQYIAFVGKECTIILPKLPNT